jgi:hypothetical protein
MAMMRRGFLATLVARVVWVGIVVGTPGAASACLVGKWRVRCPNGHDDIVDEITCNHNCEKCHALAFNDGEGNIVCPNNHVNHVSTGSTGERGKWMRSHPCSRCGEECCISQ